jgi:hypothetical protein
MDEIQTSVDEIEKRIKFRFCQAIDASTELSDVLPFIYIDLEKENIGFDNDQFWKYGFQVNSASVKGETITITGIITGELAKPFREHLHSYEVKFDVIANWWSGSQSTEQVVRVVDIEKLIIPVLHKLDEKIANTIKSGIEKHLFEILMLGERDPLANNFEELFNKDKS